MKTPKYFTIKELVDPDTYQKFGVKAWKLLDQECLICLDKLREKFGPMIINTWAYPKMQKKYGVRKFSGFRPPGCGTGTAYSQHRFGRAFDVLFANQTADEVREEVIKDQFSWPFITRLETGISWFHFDRAFTGEKTIQLFKP